MKPGVCSGLEGCTFRADFGVVGLSEIDELYHKIAENHNVIRF